jgi:hypothetical protein
MRFNKIVKSLLVINEGYKGIPLDSNGKKINYASRPQEALQALSDKYSYLKLFNHADYDSADVMSEISLNGKLSDAAYTIFFVAKASNLDEFSVRNGNRQTKLNKTDLLKNVLKFLQGFGDKNKPPFVVPEDAGLARDADGNVIAAGTELHGSDYRLSIYQDSEDIRKYGGVQSLHHVYKEIFPLLGIRYQPYRRRETRTREEDTQNFPVFYWGEDYLPYRTVLKPNAEGKLVSVDRLVQKEISKRGAAFWATDQMFGIPKAKPMAYAYAPKTAYEGNVFENKTAEEVKQDLKKADFEPIVKEASELDDFSPKQILALGKNQDKYNSYTAEQKIEIFKQQNKNFNQAKQASKEAARQGEDKKIKYDPKITFPYFSIFKKSKSGKIIRVAASPEAKFKQLYPEEQFPDLYNER